MKKEKHFIKFALLSAMIVAFGAFFGIKADAPEHTNKFYINDFANVLTPETRDYVFTQSCVLKEKTTAEVVVATVNSLDDLNVDEYALNIFRKWSVGEKGENNGLLILLAPNERRIKIEVGPGLEGKINDSKAGRFIDEYALPYFKNEKWSEGIFTLYCAVVFQVYSEYGVECPKEISDVVNGHNSTIESTQMSTVMLFIILALALVFGGILPWIFSRKYPRRFFGEGHDHHGSGFEGFGGFGDFGSGGGFGGFRGGGGTSDGGGASRGF